MQVSVNERAMQARINRKLEKEGCKLVKTQPHSAARQELGTWYIVDTNTNTISAHGIEELGKLAQELGTLKPGEVLQA